MLRILLAATLVFVAPSVAAFAEGVEKVALKTRSGEELRIGVIATVNSSCNGNPVPEIRIARAPIGGTLIIRLQAIVVPQTNSLCAGRKIASQVLFYKSDSGFTGPDAVVLDVSTPGQPTRTRDIAILVQ